MGQPLIQMDRVPISFLPPASHGILNGILPDRESAKATAHIKLEMHYTIFELQIWYAFGGHHFLAVCQLELTRGTRSGSALLAYIYTSTTHRLTACFSNGIPKSGWRPSSTCLRRKMDPLFIYFFLLSSIQSQWACLCTSFERWFWFRENEFIIFSSPR